MYLITITFWANREEGDPFHGQQVGGGTRNMSFRTLNDAGLWLDANPNITPGQILISSENRLEPEGEDNF